MAGMFDARVGAAKPVNSGVAKLNATIGKRAGPGVVASNYIANTPATPPSANAPLPTVNPAPSNPYTSYSVNSGGGGGGGGGSATPAPPAPAAPAVSQQDYLAGDGALLAQKSALEKALQDYTSNNTADLTKYNVDYGQAVDNLGWKQSVPDDPATPQNEAMAGAWNLEDQNKASGRAFQNQQNDFAGRGMMQSSAYGTAVDNLMRSLKDQLGGIDTAKTNFQQDKARGLASYTNENNAAVQQAQAEAISRYAALYGQL